MSRLLKIILSLIVSVIFLIIIAVVVIPLFVDPNDYKPEIQAAVKENLGRELSIEGDLELSVFPWLGVSTGKLALSNAKGFSDKPFAEMNESNIKIKILPLLSKQLEVSRIVLKGLSLNLAKNKKGISNWDDLVSAKTDKKADATDDTKKEDSVSPLAALAIGGISIEDANIIWDDQQKGQYTEIKNFNFATDPLAFDQPIALDLSFSVINKEPALTESISLTTGLVINEQLEQFNLNKFELTSTTSGDNIPGDKLIANLLADISLNLEQQTLNITGLKLSMDEFVLTGNISGTNIKDKPVFNGPIKIAEFNLAQLMKNIAMPLPAMQNPTALNKLSTAFNLQATTDSAAIENLIIQLDDTQIKGSGKINNFANPATAFTIHVDDIDVDRYMAPKKEGESKKVASPAAAATATAALFPVETLRQLNSNGQVTIGKLKINNLIMQGLSLKLKAKNGIIKTQQNIKQLYQGAYTGNTTINVQNKSPKLSLNEKLTKVQVEPLLKDMVGFAKMTGIVNASAVIQGSGNTSKAIKSTLNGNLNFNFKEGIVRGFNLQKIIDNGKALIEGTPLPTNNKNDQTVFSVISGTANIRNGLVVNNDLYAKASKLRVNGKGNANLTSEKLDYKVTAKLIKQEKTQTQPEKIKGVPVAFNIGGTFSKPSYTLDIAAMLLEKNKEKINKKKDELLKKLDDKIGPGVGDLIKGFL